MFCLTREKLVKICIFWRSLLSLMSNYLHHIQRTLFGSLPQKRLWIWHILKMSHSQSGTAMKSFTQTDQENEIALTEKWLGNEFPILDTVVLFKIFFWDNFRLTEELKKKSTPVLIYPSPNPPYVNTCVTTAHSPKQINFDILAYN